MAPTSVRNVRPPRLPSDPREEELSEKRELARTRWYLDLCEFAARGRMESLRVSGELFLRYHPNGFEADNVRVLLSGARFTPEGKASKALSSAMACIVAGDLSLADSYLREARANGASNEDIRKLTQNLQQTEGKG